jgi:hypothetical protein
MTPIRPEMATVLDLLDSLNIEFNIDPDRVYATGLSLGGYGTFDVVYRDPSRFAAALPMSGGYNPILADSIGEVPLWIIHGETDGTVPPYLSKNMVTAFEAAGREVFNTNCDYFGCSAKSDEELDAAMETRPDLVFMGVPNVGHGPWAPWYDDRRIQEWLLSKHRLLPETITITSPEFADNLQGIVSLEWIGGDPADSVDVMFSWTPGTGWFHLDGPIPNNGSVEINTDGLPETPFGRFQIVLIDADGFAYAKETSPLFVIDNAYQAPPVVEINDIVFRTPASFMGDSLTLSFLAGDAEDEEVAAALNYSVDGGETFFPFDTLVVARYEETLEPIDLQALPNADEAVIRIEVSDGVKTASDDSPRFRKATPRQTSTYVQQVAGGSSAGIRINFVNPEALTGHAYRVTFDVPDDGPKTYSVRDLATEVVVLSNAPINGSEGPEFDGIRLVVTDVETAEVNRDLTGWTEGDATLAASIRAPRVTLAGESIQSLATPADYRFVIAEGRVDTTAALFDFEPLPIRFTVENLTDGGFREVLFDDVNGDGLPSNGERLYILEADDDERLLPAWMLTFVRASPNIEPETGDVFELITLKPATEEDVFEFIGMIGVSREDDTIPPGRFRVHQNYPNPFADWTVVPYTLGEAAEVQLSVYDVLGRTVMTMNPGIVATGEHQIRVDAALSSGVYFYRLTVAGRFGTVHSSSKRMLVVR